VDFFATFKAVVPFLPLEGDYPAWVDALDSALDHPRRPAFAPGTPSATPTGAVAVVTAAYDAINDLPGAIAHYLSLGYAPGTGFDRNQQAEAIAELQGQLAHFRDTYPIRLKNEGMYTWGKSSPSDRGMGWNETDSVLSATSVLLGTYPSKVGTHPGVWRQNAMGTAFVAASTVAIVGTAGVGTAGLPALVPVMVGVQNRAQATMEANNPQPAETPPARAPVAVDPLEEILPFALVGLALAIGI
jgi:hypothetical protein